MDGCSAANGRLAMMTDLDLSAIAHLVTATRAAHKLAAWDRHGIDQVLASLKHLDVHELATRALGHARDPEARTPGAIRRPFTPIAPPETGIRNPRAGEACAICQRWPHQCVCTDDNDKRTGPSRQRATGVPLDPGLRANVRSATRAARTKTNPKEPT